MSPTSYQAAPPRVRKQRNAYILTRLDAAKYYADNRKNASHQKIGTEDGT